MSFLSSQGVLGHRRAAMRAGVVVGDQRVPLVAQRLDHARLHRHSDALPLEACTRPDSDGACPEPGPTPGKPFLTQRHHTKL